MGILVLAALARALLVSGGAAAMALWLGRETARRWTGAALLIWLIPDLALSYGYREVFLPLIHWPMLRELAYASMLSVKSLALSLLLLNAPLFGRDAAAQWQWLQVCPSLAWRWRRAWGGALPRFVLLALPSAWVCFHDFDWASRLGIMTWSVALFDAHAGGLPWRDTLAQSAPSLLVSLVMMATVWGLGQNLSFIPKQETLEKPARPWLTGIVLFLVTAILGYPLGIIALETVQGASLLTQQGSLLVDACLTLAWSGLAALGALLFLPVCAAPLAAYPSIAGMLGALPLGLGLTALGITSWKLANEFFPVALLIGWTLWVLPRAWLLGWLGGHLQPSPTMFLARCSDDPRLHWLYEGRILLLWLSPVWFFAYTEVLLAAMLAPPSFSPVFARLYNLMHYGRGPLLSALLLASYALVLLVLTLGSYFGKTLVKQKFDKP